MTDAPAEWEDKEAVEEFLHSEAARKFKNFVLENDIYLTTTILCALLYWHSSYQPCCDLLT